MQISGHRNIQSVNNYSHMSMSQHRSSSGILSGRVDPKQHDSTNTSINLASSHSVSCVSKNENVGLSSIFSGPILIGGWQWYLCASPTLLTPHFYFPLELYVYITLTNNYLAYFIYQLIISWKISINSTQMAVSK